MCVTAVGGVVSVERNISGSKLSVITLAQSYSGQTVEDGTWGKKGLGYFDYRVWENNLQAGLNVDMSGMLGRIKKGDQLEILAEVTDVKEVKEGKVVRRTPQFTAIRISYAGTKAPETTTPTVARVEAASDFVDVQEDFAAEIDPFA
jgi:hypothetical protein